MKKFTLILALLGSTYFVKAQVGIGTPTPKTSAILDIEANDKGVLIPRVELTSLTTFSPVIGEQVNGLLVYATGVKVSDNSPLPVPSGFYYWKTDKWERIVSQADLEAALENQTGDLTKIKALLNAAYGSNNIGNTATAGDFGGMVFTPVNGAVPAKFEYIKWNTTSNSYDKIDITSVIADLISASESKTKVVTYNNKQYYLSEDFIQGGGEVDPAEWNTVPAGAVLIDVIGSVVNNFNEILASNTTSTIDGTNQTVKQYFESLGANDLNTVYFNNTATSISVGTGTVAAYTFYLKDASGNSISINLADLVRALETDTQITKNVTGTALSGDIQINYNYFNEAQPDTAGLPQQTIDLNADLKTLIEGNTEIKNAIQNVLNQGGNVYYTTTLIAAGNPTGQLEIPANSFYTINPTTGVKTEIVIPVNINQLITAINNANTAKKNELKLALGDKLTTNNTSVFTGDTVTIGGVLHYIYKGNFTTSVTANSANTTGVTLDKTGAKILSLNLRYNNGIVANVTDVSLNNLALTFRIGTGKMYQVLGISNIDAEAIVEFASTVDPLL